MVSKVKNIIKKEFKKDNLEKGAILSLMFLSFFSLCVLFFFFVLKISFTGYSVAIPSEAGTVTSIVVEAHGISTLWKAVFGLAFRVPEYTDQIFANLTAGEVVRRDLFFSCVQSDAVGGNEVYASRNMYIDFDNLQPANLTLLDEYMETRGFDCASNTLTDTMSIMVGSRNISNIPSSETYRIDGNMIPFKFGALTDGNDFVYVTKMETIDESYDRFELQQQGVINYQLMLPGKRLSSDVFYFFTDPNDECYFGGGVDDNVPVNIYGYARDINDNPISNVSVYVAGNVGKTDELGFYNMSFPAVVGNYTFFSTREGYDNYFSNITITLNQTFFEKNFVMNESKNVGEIVSVGVTGRVLASGGAPLPGARVYLGSDYSVADSLGFYNISTFVLQGNHTIVAFSLGYDTYYDVFVFQNDNEVIFKDIILSKNFQKNADFSTGPYTEEPGEDIERIIEEIIARGEDNWISVNEIKKSVGEKSFLEDSIKILNLRKTSMELNFKLSSSLSNIFTLEKANMVLSPGEVGEVGFVIYGNDIPGTYKGKVEISGTINQEIPVEITIVEEKFPVEILLMSLNLFDREVVPGKEFKYKITLQNLLRNQGYEVDLVTQFKDLNGEKVYFEEDYEVELDVSESLIRPISLPMNFTSGDYLLEVKAKYLNLFSVATFPVKVVKPIYLYSFFGIPVWMFFVFVAFLSFVFLNLLVYKRYQDKKKRYRIGVDYHTLPEPGQRVVKLGNIAETKHPAYYEIDKLTTHAIVAGATGMGKSISAQVVIEECLMKDTAVIVFDPTAQWSGMLRKCTDKKMMSYYPKFGLKSKDARAFKGNVRMIQDCKQKIDINKHMNPGQIQIFSMNKLTPAEIDVFVANVIKQIFRSDPKESPILKILLVFDEVHRLLPKFGGSGKGFLQIERACREFRKWGLGVMLISQVLNDFVGEIKANINTELQTRTLEEGDLERIRSKFGEDFLKSLVKAEVGVIMFQNAEYNRGQPYFVNFRPILHSTRRLEDAELEKYNKYNDLVDDLEFQIEELGKQQIDIFDLKMELKLIKDKIMSGSFSVVEIYLEGLSPRVKKEWEKIGKQPPKRVIELVDDSEMEEEEKKSQAEKEKVESKKDNEGEESKVEGSEEGEEKVKEKEDEGKGK